MGKTIRSSLLMILIMTVLTGGVYPAAVTLIAGLAFPFQAGGSILVKGDQAIGSALLGQSFTDPRYFWGRPSATGPVPCNPAASSGSNLGPANPVLLDSVRSRVLALRTADPGNRMPIPVDLVTASGSGLDPDISVAGALYQIPRVARLRHRSEEELRWLVSRTTAPRDLGFLGEERVNVLALNAALDSLSIRKEHSHD
jgi:potassium-transporting ATPase KdpC subunit